METTLDLQVTGITLLSEEEYKQYRSVIPPVDFFWWLRSPGDGHNFAACVYSVGSIYFRFVNNSSLCVRPALACDPTGIAPGTKLMMLGLPWTALNESLILCDESIGSTAFRADFGAQDADVYEVSDVKRYLYEWIYRNGITMEGQ